MASNFPPFALVQSLSSSGSGSSCEPVALLPSGDVIKLLRLVRADGEKFLECRSVSQTSIIRLPFGLVGQFVAVFDNKLTYTLEDLICGQTMPRRMRRVLPISRDLPIIRGLHAGTSFHIEPDLSGGLIEARSLDDPPVVIRLPTDDSAILVAPLCSDYERAEPLATLVHNSQGLFPLSVRVVDWDEETAILENHFVRPGVELILHGTSRLDKVVFLHLLLPCSR